MQHVDQAIRHRQMELYDARRPVVLEPADAWRGMDAKTAVEEAAHITHSCSVPGDGFQWWKVSQDVNTPDPSKNRRSCWIPTSARRQLIANPVIYFFVTSYSGTSGENDARDYLWRSACAIKN
jgi:hypothetical protein